MTEFVGDEFSQFLDEEAARAREQAESRARVATFEQQLLAALDENDATHLWHPDRNQVDQNVVLAAAELEADDDLRTELQENGLTSLDAVKVRSMSEEIMTYAIEAMMIIKDCGLAPSEEAREKKRLLARLQSQGFDEGWQRAVDSLFDGPVLDLTNEDDVQLYVDNLFVSHTSAFAPL